MRDFRKFEVWHLAMEITDDIFNLTERLPSDERFNLISQLNRAAVSVPSNIAEGCSRASDKEFARFLEISMGSSFEILTQIEICAKRNYIEKTQFIVLTDKINLLQKRMNSLRSKLLTIKN